MDPVSQVLAQQNSGSAGGQGFGDFFMQGRQQALEKQRLNLSSRHLKLQEHQDTRTQEAWNALKPFLDENAKNEAANLGLQVVANKDKAAVSAQYNSALPEILQLQSAFMQAPDGFSNQELRMYADVLGQRFPRAFAPGMPGGDLMLEINGGTMNKMKFQRLREIDKQMEGTGRSIKDYNFKTGEIQFMRDSNELPAKLQEVIALTHADAKAQKITDPDKLNALYATNLRDTLIPYGMSVTTPEGVTVTTGRQPVATVSKAEDVINQAVNIVNFGGEVMRLAKPGNVGIMGNLNRLAVEFGGQIGEVKAGEEFNYAQASALFKSKATGILKSDSQISEAERKQIIADLPGSGVAESDESAKAKASYALKQIAQSARRQAMRAGRPLPPELMTPTEIVKAQRDGKLTRDEALHALKISPID